MSVSCQAWALGLNSSLLQEQKAFLTIVSSLHSQESFLNEVKTEENFFPQSYTRLKDGIPLLFSWGHACFPYMKGESDAYKLFLLASQSLKQGAAPRFQMCTGLSLAMIVSPILNY